MMSTAEIKAFTFDDDYNKSASELVNSVLGSGLTASKAIKKNLKMN